jgi:hypothetical protein
VDPGKAGSYIVPQGIMNARETRFIVRLALVLAVGVAAVAEELSRPLRK